MLLVLCRVRIILAGLDRETFKVLRAEVMKPWQSFGQSFHLHLLGKARKATSPEIREYYKVKDRKCGSRR